MAEESNLQTKALNDVRGTDGCFATKIEKASDNGFPDVFVTTLWTGPFVVEFKSPGKDAKSHQKTMHATLQRCGCRTFVCDTWERWMEIKKEMGLWPRPTTPPSPSVLDVLKKFIVIKNPEPVITIVDR